MPEAPILTVTPDVTQLALSWSTQPQLSTEIFLLSPDETTPSLVQTVFSGVNAWTISGLLPATPYTVSVVNVAGAGEAAKKSEPAVQMRNTGTELVYFILRNVQILENIISLRSQIYIKLTLFYDDDKL